MVDLERLLSVERPLRLGAHAWLVDQALVELLVLQDSAVSAPDLTRCSGERQPECQVLQLVSEAWRSAGKLSAQVAHQKVLQCEGEQRGCCGEGHGPAEEVSSLSQRSVLC